MKKKMIGIIALGTFLLLAGCSSKGEVKRDAHGRKVLSGYITLSGAFAFIRWQFSGLMSFTGFIPRWILIFRQVGQERELLMCLPTRWILRW